MNFRYLLALMASLSMLFSCVREEDNIKSIPFDKIIGSYTGISRSCESQNISTDTICGPGIANTFRVIIFDLTTISISDQTNKYEMLKLSYVKTESSGGDQIHTFESKDSLATYTASYSELLRNFTFENKKITDINIITDFFEGKK